MAAGTRLTAAAQVWMAEIDESKLAAASKQLYRAAARIYLCPTLGEVRLGELNVAIIERALEVIGDELDELLAAEGFSVDHAFSGAR
jgi:hypothetical protein